MRIKNGWLTLAGAVALAVFTAACDNTADGVKQDTAEAHDEMKDEAAEARTEGRETTGEAGSAMDAAMETMDVKAALMGNDMIDASDINVDTMHETKTVVLKGSVPTDAHKTEAMRIAEREAPGYRIDNQLTVRPRS